MSSDIATASLEVLCEAVIDCPHSTPVWMDSGVIVLRSSNIRNGRLDLSSPSYTDEYHYEERSRRARIQAGDLIITREAPMGEVCLVPENLKCCLGQRMVLLRPDREKCHGKYLLYALQSRQVQNQIQSHEGTGSTVSNLRIPVLKDLAIPSPDIRIQKAIAHILGTLDDKIELNRKTNETLEAMAKALFKSWFVDFDPVRAKAEGRPTGLPADISDLFPDSFEDSELGEIPNGWKAGCLSDCCEITMGQSPPGNTYNEDGDGLPFYQGKTDFGFRFPGRRVYCSAPTRWAPIGATLISVRAPVGSANIAREVCSIGRGIAALTSRHPADSFLYYLVGTLQGVFESYNSEGTVFGAINGKDLASIQVVKPREEVSVAFNHQCLPIDESIKTNTLEIEYLTALRDALLPKLISGELRITEAEKLLEEAGV